MGVFKPVDREINFPASEVKWLDFWKNNDIFNKQLAQGERRAKEEGKSTYVFYEGPPTANGMPHPGHVLTRVVKDLFPRYRAMQGYNVPRKAGWDTHGLPVEVEVCKERQWTLHEQSVASNHVHVVVTAQDALPERVMQLLKAKATKMLRKAGFVEKEEKIWTQHGSTKYVFNEKNLENVCDYVRNQ